MSLRPAARRVPTRRAMRTMLALAFAPAAAVLVATSGGAPSPPVAAAARSPIPGAAAAPIAVREPISTVAAVSAPDWWSRTATRAAATCPGLPASVLVSIARVETALVPDTAPSPAGAVGPMQFLPSTWAAYGVDGDRDGAADVMDPVDALYGAAHLLCANGGADPARLRSALWNYNHSHTYVERVMRLAGLIGGSPADS